MPTDSSAESPPNTNAPLLIPTQKTRSLASLVRTKDGKVLASLALFPYVSLRDPSFYSARGARYTLSANNIFPVFAPSVPVMSILYVI